MPDTPTGVWGGCCFALPSWRSRRARHPDRGLGAIGQVGMLLCVAVLALTACDPTRQPDEQSPLPEPTAQVGPTPSTSVEPADNGLVAYSSDGDIHVGDPATGATRPITTSEEFEVNPIFSPDGTRIAFMRGKLNTDAVVVVVDSDGSHERVVFPRGGDAMFVGVFSWTPDGLAILVGADSPDTEYWDGILALADAAGLGEVRLLTPPLPKSIGSLPWNVSAQVAPMLDPSAGELILSVDLSVHRTPHGR